MTMEMNEILDKLIVKPDPDLYARISIAIAELHMKIDYAAINKIKKNKIGSFAHINLNEKIEISHEGRTVNLIIRNPAYDTKNFGILRKHREKSTWLIRASFKSFKKSSMRLRICNTIYMILNRGIDLKYASELHDDIAYYVEEFVRDCEMLTEPSWPNNRLTWKAKDKTRPAIRKMTFYLSPHMKDMIDPVFLVSSPIADGRITYHLNTSQMFDKEKLLEMVYMDALKILADLISGESEIRDI